MALPEQHERQLSEADRLFIFRRATESMCGARDRWAKRAQAPMTDKELQEAIEWEVGFGGFCAPNEPDVEYHGLKIWGGWHDVRRTSAPLWSGASTIAKAREVYGIKTPDEFREPSLFDFVANA